MKKIYLGFLEAHVLHHASIMPIYGQWMIQELNHHGYHVGPSHIYPLLNQMEKQGLLIKEEKNDEVKDKLKKVMETLPTMEISKFNYYKLIQLQNGL
jgi:DNA-binding PadR family transcriptional regulator